MLHRALKTCSRWSVMGCILALSSALSAQVAGDQRRDPNGEYQIAEGVIRAAANQQNPRLATLLKEGAEAYRRAEFSVAMDFYEDAARVAPDRADIQSLLQLAGEKRALQRQALETIPKTKSKRDQYYKALYDEGREHYKNKDFARAYEVLYSLWLVRGDYKDTLDLIEKSRAKGKVAEGEPSAPAEIAAPAEAAPAPAEEAPAPAEAQAQPEPQQAAPADEVIAAATRESEPVQIAAAAPQAAPAKADLASLAENADKPPPLDPESKLRVDTLTLEAQIEAQAGRSEAAMALYEQALQIDPENRVVLRGMDKLRSELRATEAASATVPAERPAPAEPAPAQIVRSEPAAIQAAPAASPRAEQIASLPAAPEPQPVRAAVVPAPQAEAAPTFDAPAAPAPAPLEPAPAALETAPQAAPPPMPSAPAEPAPAPRAENVQARVTALLAQAKAAQENGKYDFADELYREALSLDGSNRAAEKGLEKVRTQRVAAAIDEAEAMAKASRPEEAAAKYQEALKTDPTNKKAKKGLEAAEKLLAKSEEAAAIAKLDAEVAGARQEIAAGNYAAARIALESVLAQAPQHKAAADEMARIASLEAAASAPAAQEIAALAPEAAPALAPAAEPATAPAPAAAAPAAEATAAPFSINAEKLEAQAAAESEKKSFVIAQAGAAPASDAKPAGAPQTPDEKRKWDPLESTCRHASLSIL